ncbi:hypothetical protein P4K96_30640 [Bacillus cereus]|nr:hypothetical protein [Bacillus cereus]
MGRITRDGYGCGMDEFKATSSFLDWLKKTYGEERYDITNWISVECIEEPILPTTAEKTKMVRVSSPRSGRLVNGFCVTTKTPKLIALQHSIFKQHHVVAEAVEEFALTLKEAKEKGSQMAKKYDTPVHVIPCRVWQDEQSRTVPGRVLEITPVGGKMAKPGKWHFEVEIRD